MPTFESALAEIAALAATISEGPEVDTVAFWAALRDTSIPYLPTYFRSQPELGHRLSAAALRAVGRKNIGLGYALENHLFVVGGLETYAAVFASEPLHRLLDQLCELRHLIANTHGYIHGDRAFSEGLVLRKAPGGVFIEGNGTFLSLAGAADWLLLLLDGAESSALFFHLKDNPSIRFGALSFPKMLVESDTRSLQCDGTFVPQEHYLPIPPEHLTSGGAFSTALLAWHLSLSVGQFLGGASALVDHALGFAHQFKSFDNRTLDRLDGVAAELGQVGLRIGAIEAMLGEAARSLPHGPAADLPARFAEMLFRAQVANHQGMELIEEISRRCRRILGTRLFSPAGAPFDRISSELLVGPLVPRNNSLLERDAAQVLIARGRLASATSGEDLAPIGVTTP